jgi:hypothetical protein
MKNSGGRQRCCVTPYLRACASVACGKPTRGRALLYWITPGCAEALGLRLRQGRFFEADDRRARTLRTIVNDEFVRQHLASPQAAGLMLPSLVQAEGKLTAEIIGVVGDVLKDGHDRQPQPALSTSSTVHTACVSPSASTW